MVWDMETPESAGGRIVATKSRTLQTGCGQPTCLVSVCTFRLVFCMCFPLSVCQVYRFRTYLSPEVESLTLVCLSVSANPPVFVFICLPVPLQDPP